MRAHPALMTALLGLLLIVTTAPAQTAPVWGFADLHTHPASHLAFGADASGNNGRVRHFSRFLRSGPPPRLPDRVCRELAVGQPPSLLLVIPTRDVADSKLLLLLFHE
jgi:hypothetical protein